MSYALGIDVGTTFSAAAVATGGRTDMVQLGTRSAAIPSVVVIRPDGEILTGEAAERRSVSEPTRTGREFKRRLGDPVPLLLGGAPYGAEALTAYLIRAMVDRVSQEMGKKPDVIAVSHPASYGPYKIDLLRQAARLADVGDVTFIAEPQAAAIYYAQTERLVEGNVLAVYDFGGGTFDAAVLRKTSNSFATLGTPEGLERLGGIDFDEAVFAHVLTSLGGLVQALDPEDEHVRTGLARLREECRNAKEALSIDTDTVIPVSLPNVHTEVRLTRSELEAMVRPRIGETLAALERAVRSAGLTFAEVDRILLVGGTSRMPILAQMVREATGCQIGLDAHPKHAIALGAAAAAYQQLEVPNPAAVAAAPASPTPVPAAIVAGERPPAGAYAPPAGQPYSGAGPSARRTFEPRVVLAAAGVVVLVAVVAFLAFGRGGSTKGGGTLASLQSQIATSGSPTATATAASQALAATPTRLATATATAAAVAAPRYPAAVTANFVSSCLATGGTTGYCQCTIEYIQAYVPYDAYLAADQQIRAGSTVLPQWATDASVTCTPVR